MKLYYDLHIHSCLSPCADDDMTPQNIVGMAKLKGLNLIALTDHNSCKNCAPALSAAKRESILLLPGMELCTSEEAHILCLFEELDGALEFEKYVYSQLPDIKNRPKIFGRQLIIDENDDIAGFEPRLLLNAARISAAHLRQRLDSLGGVAIPAHIDRPSYSLFHRLGSIPDEYGFKCIEFSDKGDDFLAKHPDFARSFMILRSSDAHALHEISEPGPYIEIDAPTPRKVVNLLRNGMDLE